MPDYISFAGNAFNQVTEAIDYTDPHAPSVKTYHGIALAVNNKVLGRVQSWSNSGAYTREGEHVRELNNQTFGRPVDYVPGIATGYTISASVAELWGKEIEIQTGSSNRYIDLISQTRPFQAQEFWHKGVEIYEVWTYLGCWLQDRNESEYSVTGDLRVVANFNFAYVSRVHTASA